MDVMSAGERLKYTCTFELLVFLSSNSVYSHGVNISATVLLHFNKRVEKFLLTLQTKGAYSFSILYTISITCVRASSFIVAVNLKMCVK